MPLRNFHRRASAVGLRYQLQSESNDRPSRRNSTICCMTACCSGTSTSAPSSPTCQPSGAARRDTQYRLSPLRDSYAATIMPLPRCRIPILTVAGLIEIAALQPNHPHTIDHRLQPLLLNLSHATRQSLKQMLPMKPQIHAPASCNRGHESGQNQTEGSGPNGRNLRLTVSPVGSIPLILSASCAGQRGRFAAVGASQAAFSSSWEEPRGSP